MYSIEEIKNLMESFRESGLTDFNLEYRDFKLSLGKSIGKTIGATEITEKMTDVNTYIDTPTELEQSKKVLKVEETKVQKAAKVIKAPMVGTFYEAISPDSKAFVNLGDKVTKGQTLCILEAMKLMNEIESEFDGTIVEILVKNEDFIEYGQPLFVIE